MLEVVLGFLLGALAVFLSYTMGLRQGFLLSRGREPELRFSQPANLPQPVVDEPDEDDWARRE